MEMISAVKMRRAVANVLATRNYASLAWEMLKEISEYTHDGHHALLQKRPVKKIGLILITSNRGLAGGFSSRLLQEVDSYIKKITHQTVIPTTRALRSVQAPEESLAHSNDGQRSLVGASLTRDDKVQIGIEADIILTGKRGKKIYHRFGHTVVAEFDKVDLTTRIEEILPMAQLAVKEFVAGTYDQIVVAYMHFKSAIEQVATVKQILPLTKDSIKELAAKEADDTEEIEESTFLFEPNPALVLDVLLPRLVEMQMYQAILESDASEHSARMMAMRNASDSASDMIKELQNSFNKARQAAITQEISEIVGGAAALE